MTTISIYLYNQTFPQFVVNLIISDIIPSVNRLWKNLSYSSESSRFFVHFASQISVRHLFFSGCNNYHWYFFSVNDKRSRRSWSYNHNLRLLLALIESNYPMDILFFTSYTASFPLLRCLTSALLPRLVISRMVFIMNASSFIVLADTSCTRLLCEE